VRVTARGGLFGRVILSGACFGTGEDRKKTPKRKQKGFAHFLRRGRDARATSAGMRGVGGAKRKAPAQIDFTRATIDALEIVEPLPTLDLHGATLHQWVGDNAKLLALVEQHETFDKGVYRAVEALFVNGGDEINAKKTHVAMRKRDREDHMPKMQMVWSWLLYITIGYGTRSLPLGLVMLAMFVLSVSVMWNCANVEPSEIGLAATNTWLKPNDTPCKTKQWVWTDAVWMAARYHLPLVHIDAVDEWDPSTTARLHIGAMSLGITPQGWMSSMSVVNAVAWPLLLVSLSGYLRRTD